MTWYSHLPNHNRINYRIQYAKSADHYTPEQIEELYSLCKSQYERDFLVDRLYLSQCEDEHEHRYRTKNSQEYYYLDARKMSRQTKAKGIETSYEVAFKYK